MALDAELVERVGYVFVARVMSSLGIIGNLISIFILQRRSLNDSPYTYLSAITGADLIVMAIFLGLGFVRCGTCTLTHDQAYYTKYYELFIYLPFVNMAANSSLFIAVAMTVERFVFVRFPLMAKKVCNRNKARVVTGAIILIAIVVNLPRFFLFSICHPPECDVSTIHGMIPNPLSPSFLTMECAFAPMDMQRQTPSVNTSMDGMSRCVIFTRYNNATFEVDGVIIVNHPILAVNITTLNVTNPISHSPVPNQRRFDLKIRKCNTNNIKPTNKPEDVTPTSDKDLSINIGEQFERDSYLFFNWTSFLKPNLLRPIMYATSYFGRSVFDKNVSLPYDSYHAASDNIDLYWKLNDSRAISSSIRSLLRSYHQHVVINITNGTLITNLLTQFPCLKENKSSESINRTNISKIPLKPGKTKIPAIPYDPNYVKFTIFYQKFHEMVYQGVLALETFAASIIIVLNVLMVRILRQNFQKRKELVLASATFCSPRASMSVAAYAKHVHEQQRLTFTLVAITCLVALTTVFCAITSDPFAKIMYGTHYRQNKGFRVYGVIANLLVTVNHSINFALYALFNRRFQQELRSTLVSIWNRCTGCIKLQCANVDTPTSKHRRLTSVRTISTSSSWTEETASISSQEVSLQSVTSLSDLSM